MSRVTIEQALNIGIQHHNSGRLQEAENVYRQILSHDANQVDAMHLLGVIAHQCGHHDPAIELIGRSLQLQPNNSAAWTNIGEALRAKGRMAEAINSYLKAIEQNPAAAEAMGNLGLVYTELERTDEAIEQYNRALVVNPNMATTHSNLGNALLKKGQLEAALAEYEIALKLDPNFADAHNNRGSALENLDRLEEAMTSYMRAVELNPKFAIAANNTGNVMRRLCRWEEAMMWCKRSLEMNPGYEPAMWNVGLLELTAGNYQSGWPKHELRFSATPQRLPPGLDRPRWDGSPLNGKTILLYAEQGIGDGFQAIRYVPMVVARGGRVIIECHKAQLSYFKEVPGVAEVFVTGEPRLPHDVFVPMMSLPLLFNTTVDTIPRDVPYLHAEAARVAAWKERLSQYSGLKVGLVWRGRPNPEPLRSCPLAELAPLGSVPNVTLFSLQVQEGSEELHNPPAGLNIVDLGPEVMDFRETGACLMNLDLMLTIDTAIAHIAGALGRPTWVMLPVSPDWRWMLNRQDCVWYPTIRVFRQTKRKVWTDVVEKLTEELRLLAEKHQA